MQDDRNDLGAALVAPAALARIHRTDHHRIDDFQVRRVERQRQVHRAGRRIHVGRETHVVLDVAGRQVGCRLALEFREQHRRRLAQRIHQHVQPAAVRHADDDLLCALRGRDTHQFVHGDDGRFAALEREALLADILGMQVALHRFGRRHAFQEALAVFDRVAVIAAHRLQPSLDPALVRDVGHVHVFGADAAAIHLTHRFEDFAQAGAVIRREAEGTGAEHVAQVGFGEAVMRGLQFGNVGPFGPLERIELSPAIAEEAVGIDHLQHADLTLVVGGRAGRTGRTALGQFGERRDDRRMGHVGSCARQMLQGFEVAAPGIRYGTRIGEIGLVQFLDKGRIAPEEVGMTQHLHHDSLPRPGLPGLVMAMPTRSDPGAPVVLRTLASRGRREGLLHAVVRIRPAVSA